MAMWPSARLVMANSVPLLVFLLMTIIVAAQPNMLAAAAEEPTATETMPAVEKRKPSRRFGVPAQNKDADVFCVGTTEELKHALADGAFVEDMQQPSGTPEKPGECPTFPFVGIKKPLPTTKSPPTTTATTTATKKPKGMLNVPISNANKTGSFLEAELRANWRELVLTFIQADMQPLLTYYGSRQKCLDNDKKDCFSVELIPAQGLGQKQKHSFSFDFKRKTVAFLVQIRSEYRITIQEADSDKVKFTSNRPILDIVAIEQDGDFVGNFIERPTIRPKKGIIFPLDKQIKPGNSLIIPWILRDNTESVKIKMISFKPNEPNTTVENAAPCFKEESELTANGEELKLKNSENCMTVLDIDIKFERENRTLINVTSEKFGYGHHKIWQEENTDKELQSHDYGMKIKAVTCKQKDPVSGNVIGELDAFLVDQVGMTPVINSKDAVNLLPSDVNMFWVYIDKGFVLFEEIRVEIEMEPANNAENCPKLTKN